ncbi:hypothetical protein C0Q70_20845 [Pomacea canaliculata]|uniref:Uncharacterized protein n=1 Tax=Pomacea canaliculata TaxID=400727 RepID=A0A2T7NAU6_POMCA|nr:fas apoptotic inhibitory molecule 1-like [Pomacea canaliculata]PVD18296.1 hypothetical protein C0Q70_20845 [Pomacea canaliculata]
MSVILTACKNSRQRAIERALKRRAEKRRKKQAAATAAASLAAELAIPDDTKSLKVWTFLLNGKPNSVVLHLDTLDVTCNGEDTDSQSEFVDGGSKVSFWLGDHNAQIITEAAPSRSHKLIYTLAIDGYVVPD